MDITVIDGADSEVEAMCDLCGEPMEYQFAHVEDLSRDDIGEVDICHDCITHLADMIEHETRSK